MAVSPEDVKKLREKTGAGFMDCKRALEEANGDFEKAVDELRKKGVAVAAKREGRTASQGIIASYIHAGDQVGVLVEVNCETDFVARTEDFRGFAHNVAMQIVAMQPRWVSRDEVPGGAMDREREVLTAQAQAEGKPDDIVQRMVEGRLKKFYEEYCLLDQKYIRDDSMTISDLLLEVVGRTGEKVAVRRFVRFQVGEEL
jgi:elongation factor Ts